MAGTNNFKIFNVANDANLTMSDEEYDDTLYRLNGLIPQVADPKAHNKMYRQWSIMTTAVANMIADKNYNALDSDITTLTNNLVSAVGDVAEAKVDSRINTLENWKDDITATPTEINVLDGITASTAELNILHGVTASTSELNILDGVTADTAELNTLDGAEISTTELNYLSGASSNIQQQINNLSISALFSLWIASRAYSVGDVVKTLASSFWVYLECVVAGTSDTTEPTFTNVGELVTDGTVKWLVLDMRDSAPVGSIRQDLIKRDGWLKLNGATVNVADYPRLVNFLIDNSLIQAYTATPNATEFTYGDSNNETLILPDFEGLFIENSVSGTLDKVSAGLPNITGTANTVRSLEFNSNDTTSDKALFWVNDKTQGQHPQMMSNSSGKVSSSNLGFDASRSNSIYGNSNTVQPPAVKLLPIIKY